MKNLETKITKEKNTRGRIKLFPQTGALLLTFGLIILTNCSSSSSSADSSVDDPIDKRDNLTCETLDTSTRDAALYDPNDDYAAGDLPDGNAAGPKVTSVGLPGTTINGGAIPLALQFDQSVDSVRVQIDGDSGYYTLPVNGNSLNTNLFISNRFFSRMNISSADLLNQYCDSGNFVVPGFLDGVDRYEEFFDDYSAYLDQLCNGDSFEIPSFLDSLFSEKELTTFFPPRGTNTVRVQAVRDGVAGPISDETIDVQRVKAKDAQVSLFFSDSTDLDLHIREATGDHIYYGNTSSNTGNLDLDSNPACNYDHVNNENVYWASPDAGEHKIILHYWEACVKNDVDFIITYRAGEQVTSCSGTISAGDEHEYWWLGNLVVE